MEKWVGMLNESNEGRNRSVWRLSGNEGLDNAVMRMEPIILTKSPHRTLEIACFFSLPLVCEEKKGVIICNPEKNPHQTLDPRGLSLRHLSPACEKMNFCGT